MPTLRYAGDEAPVDLDDLDADIRAGRVPGHAELRHAPWTGSSFLRLDSIPALADALDSPHARLATHLGTEPGPVGWLVPLVVVSLAGVVQLVLLVAGVAFGETGRRLFRLYEGGATGLDPLVFEGAWWSPVASQLVHAGPGHLLPNLAVLGYAGWRVNRAVGDGAFAAICGASVLGGVTAVTLFQDLPVIGSSILGYGLWGAQVAVGFRFGDAIPPERRGNYGFGTLPVLVLLFVGGLQNAQASHLGHLGGLAGGVLATLLLTPDAAVPRVDQVARRRRLLAVGLGLLLAPSLLGPLVRTVPWIALGWPTDTLVEEPGVLLALPGRLARHAVTVGPMEGWGTSAASDEALFVGLDRPRTADDLAALWAARTGLSVEPVEPPGVLLEGWESTSLLGRDDEGRPDTWVELHRRTLGEVVQEVGWVVEARTTWGGRVVPGRRAAAFRRVAASAVGGLPGSTVAAEERWQRGRDQPAAVMGYAAELVRCGLVGRADEVLGGYEDGREAGGVVAARLELWRQHGLDGDEAWLVGRMERFPGDLLLQVHGVEWLAERGRCAVARDRVAELQARASSPEVDALAGVVGACVE